MGKMHSNALVDSWSLWWGSGRYGGVLMNSWSFWWGSDEAELLGEFLVVLVGVS